jgi:two-component system NtrC family sensor kinase
LVKPCELDVLTISVERALERRMLLRNARRYKQDLENRNAELARKKTEMERLQAQVLQVEKMASLGQLAAGIAHELNNPAGFIYSNIDLLKEHIERLKRCLSGYDHVELSPEAAARITAIKKEIDYDNIVADLGSILSDCHIGAERIRDVVQNLRLFSRLDESAVKRVDLNEGIESTVRLLSGYYKSGSISLVSNYGEIPQVNCYAAQLNQVWMNLLVNAAQALGESDGEVRITTRCEGRNVIVSINDNGPGIAPEQVKKIFDPFFTTKPVGEGTGLGLSISHGIIERHGGKIEVESAPGQGTTFTISLPVDAELDLAPAN